MKLEERQEEKESEETSNLCAMNQFVLSNQTVGVFENFVCYFGID